MRSALAAPNPLQSNRDSTPEETLEQRARAALAEENLRSERAMAMRLISLDQENKRLSGALRTLEDQQQNLLKTFERVESECRTLQAATFKELESQRGLETRFRALVQQAHDAEKRAEALQSQLTARDGELQRSRRDLESACRHGERLQTEITSLGTELELNRKTVLSEQSKARRTSRDSAAEMKTQLESLREHFSVELDRLRTIHPLRDYLHFTERELQRLENMPPEALSDPERKSRWILIGKLRDQRDFLTATLKKADLRLEQQARSFDDRLDRLAREGEG